MTILVLFVGVVVILAAMLYLTLAVNEFEKKTKALSDLLQERYTLPEIPKKKLGFGGPAPGTPAAAPSVPPAR